MRLIARLARFETERRPAALRPWLGCAGAALEPRAAFVVGFTDGVLGGTAAAVAASHAVAAVAGLGASATERPAAVRGVEVKGESACGRAAALAALALVFAELLQAETASAEEVLGVTESLAAVVRPFAGLIGQGATAVGDAGLPVEEVLAAIRRRLATALGVVTAGVALTDAVAAALALVAA